MNIEEDWSTEWPTTPGYYWIYGYIKDFQNYTSLRVVEAYKISEILGFGYLCIEGRLYEEVSGKVVWKPLPPPDCAMLEKLKEALDKK